MSPLVRALHAEALKLKRTLALRMVVVAPLLVAALQFMIVWERGVDAKFDLWDTLSNVSLSAWAVFVFPLLITLTSALVCGIDHGERNWKHLFALPVPRQSVYVAKLLVALVLAGVGTAILAVLTILTGWFFVRIRPELAAAAAPPYGFIVKHAAMSWLAAWWIIAIQAWVSIRWSSFTLACSVGIAGTFFAVFAAGARLGAYYPWLLPINVLSKERVATALVLGIAGGIVAAIAGCVEWSRRDVL